MGTLHHQRSTVELGYKFSTIGEDFNPRRADLITKQDIQDWLLENADEREWSPATRNRYQAAFSLVFSVAVENDKLTINPAAKNKRKAEHNDRIRFLSDDEDIRLTKVIREQWFHYLPAFLISIHTGMRAGEQFSLDWSQVSLSRKTVTLTKAKAGKTRHIPLNAIALDAFKELGHRSGNQFTGPVFMNTE